LKTRRARVLLLTILVIVGAASLAVRQVNHLRRPGANGEWFSADPDSQYHMRRVDRVLVAGLPVAAHDPLLDFQGHGEAGAPIPWPPYYTLVAYACAAPGAPADAEARRVHVEHVVARLPSVFAALASMLAALAAWRLAGPAGALTAGMYHAFLFASLKYSHVGTGDHHAFVSCMHAALLYVACRAFEPGALVTKRAGLGRGVLAGVLAGLLLGVWVASLMHLVLFELALVWMVRVNARKERPGFGPFAVAFHLAAAAVLVPAAWDSPWAGASAEAVLNLSWLHVAGLVLCALVYAPLLHPSKAVRGKQLLVLLVLCAASLVVLPFTPLAGAAHAALDWATGADRFMGHINESQPLLMDGRAFFLYLGWGVLVLPLAWGFATALAVRGRHAFVPWVVAVPALFVLALLQRRFGELLGIPMAVLLGACVGQLDVAFARLHVFKLAFVLAVAANPSPARTTWKRMTQPATFGETHAAERDRVYRAMYTWLRESTPHRDPPEYSVLAQWDHGHGIEWAGERATVATNFGSFLGEDSYLDPWRYFLAQNEAEAEAILTRRRVRYILLASDWRRNQATMLAALPGSSIEGSTLESLGKRVPDHLRVVHYSLPESHAGVSGTIYEYVAGARFEARGVRGSELVASVRVNLPGGGGVVWNGRARAGGDGIARLRVPYSGSLVWSFEGQRGERAVSEEAVYSGLSIELR